ncbi:putative post-transcriptional gene silencing PAZ-Argonaute family protein [Helianthus annuus]|nr:putative post-transcriptional gene silencing PAZ-Argonaute family protein [Helianthus annuus]
MMHKVCLLLVHCLLCRKSSLLKSPSRMDRNVFSVLRLSSLAKKEDLHYMKNFLCGRQRDSPTEIIQALSVVLKETTLTDREVDFGQSLFSPNIGKGALSDDVEFWRGFYQSLRPTQMGLSLNLDVSASVFYEPMFVSDFIKKFLNKDLAGPLTDEDRIKVNRALKGVRGEGKCPDYTR